MAPKRKKELPMTASKYGLLITVKYLELHKSHVCCNGYLTWKSRNSTKWSLYVPLTCIFLLVFFFKPSTVKRTRMWIIRAHSYLCYLQFNPLARVRLRINKASSIIKRKRRSTLKVKQEYTIDWLIRSTKSTFLYS